MKLGEAFVDIVGDNSKLKRELKDSEKQARRSTRKIDKEVETIGDSFDKVSNKIDNFASTMRAAAAGAVVALASIGTAGFYLAKTASDIEELENLTKVAFGNMADDIRNWSTETADRINRSRYEIQRFAATAKSMVQSMVDSEEEANNMAKTITELSYDLASLRNISDERAFQAITSAITGEAEALKRLGVNVQQSALEQFAMNKGLEQGVREMDLATKTSLRYELILQKLSKAQGDAERTSGSFQNQLKGFRGEVKELAVEYGENLIPVAKNFLGIANDMVGTLAGLDEETQNTILQFTGMTSAVLGSVVALGLLATAAQLVVKGLGIVGSILGVITSTTFLAGAAIAAVGVLAYQAWDKDWQGIRTTISNFADDALEKFNNIKKWFKETDLFKTAKKEFSNIKKAWDESGFSFDFGIQMSESIANIAESFQKASSQIRTFSAELRDKSFEELQNINLQEEFAEGQQGQSAQIATDLIVIGKNIAKAIMSGISALFNLSAALFNAKLALTAKLTKKLSEFGAKMLGAIKKGLENVFNIKFEEINLDNDWVQIGKDIATQIAKGIKQNFSIGSVIKNQVINAISKIPGFDKSTAKNYLEGKGQFENAPFVGGGGKKGGYASDFGFKSGGMTGDVGVNNVAGVVHGGEWVMPAWMVDSFPSLVGMLEGMRKGKGFRNGGGVGTSVPTGNLTNKNVGGFISGVAEKMNQFTNVVVGALRTLSEVLIQVADVIGGAFGVEDLGQKIRDKIKGLIDSFRPDGTSTGATETENQTQQSKENQEQLTGLSKAFKEGKIVANRFFSSLSSQLPGLKGAIETYKGSISEGLSKPASLASGALSLIADTSPEVQEAMKNVKDGLSSLVAPIGNLISQLGPAGNALMGAGVGFQMGGPFGAVIGGISGLIGGSDDAAEEQRKAAEAAQKAAEEWQKVLESDLPNQFDEFKEINTDRQEELEKVKEINDALDAYYSDPRDIENVEKLDELFLKFRDGLDYKDRGVPGTIVWLKDFRENFEGEIENLEEKIKELSENIKDYLSISTSDLQSNVESAFDANNVKDFVSKVSNNLYSSIRSALIKAFLETSAIKDRLQDISDTVFKGIGQALADGEITTDEIEDIKEGVKGDVDEITEESKAFFKILDELGLGMDDLKGTVNEVTESLTNVPSGFKIALERFQVSQPKNNVATSSVGTSMANMPSSQKVEVNINGDVVDRDRLVSDVKDGVKQGMRESNVRQNGNPVQSTPNFAG